MLYGYSRISTSGQKETSLEVQAKFHEQLAKQLGQNFTDIREVGSGKDANRPKLQRLISTVKPGDIVSFIENSRLGRNTEENLKIIRAFTEKGARVYVAGREYKTEEVQDELTFTLESAISTYSRKLQNSKAKASIDLQRANGNFVYGRLLGYDQYKKRGKHYAEINKEEADKLRKAYKKFLASEPIFKISKDLNIYLATLIIALNNPIYCGYYLDTVENNKMRQDLDNDELKKHFIKSNIYEPIIDEETFFQFRDKYRQNHKTKEYVFRDSTHDLTGIYKCLCCGAGFVFITSRMKINGKDYEYKYYENNFPRVNCRSHKKYRFTAGVLEKVTKTFLILALKMGIEVAGFFAETKNALLQNAEDLIEKNNGLKQEIASKNGRISRIKELILDGTIEAVDFKDNMSTLKSEISVLEKQVEENERIIDYKNQLIEDVLEEEAKDNLEEFLHTDNKRDFYKRFVKKAYILNKDKLEIEFINTKKFCYEKGAFVMSYMGQEQVNGAIKEKLVFDPVKTPDKETTKYLNNYYQNLAAEVNEIINS